MSKLGQEISREIIFEPKQEVPPAGWKEEAMKGLMNAGLLDGLKKVYGRSFRMHVDDSDDRKIRIVIEQQDSGNENMTVHDLAALLQTDVKTVRRMTEARAQRIARFPVPFFKIHGKMLRFNRQKIQEWLRQMSEAAPTFTPEKPRLGRKRKV